jgi:glycosyltransferase involved in cell wall biosynthesis
MNQPLVTIVIAAYKSQPEYLSAALESAVCQTWREVEVIVGDDSPDQTLREVVASFNDPRIIYRHNRPSLGVARNHWTRFREARGEYIAVLNHDDCFAPTFLERLVPPLEQHPELALAFCDQWIIDAEGKVLLEETEKQSAGYKRAQLAEGVHRPLFGLVGSETIELVRGTVFRRKLLPAILPDDAGPAYDMRLTYLLCKNGLGAFYTSDRLHNYRYHADMLSRRLGVDGWLAVARSWREISCDRNFALVHRTARHKVSQAYVQCALASYREDQRWDSFLFGVQSLRMVPSFQGMGACFLPLLPQSVVDRLLLLRRWVTSDPGSDRYRRLAA